MIFLTALLFTLSACREEAHSVDFFKSSPEARADTMSACEIGLGSETNCRNAHAAQDIVESQNNRSVVEQYFGE
ncbi:MULTISPECIES: EexN family lipoprotein [Phaeobacter]|uniref:EexN family lipoprotein n=1 Tax=Phaeobacter TaxID=302485 RepID=UPI003A899CAA